MEHGVESGAWSMEHGALERWSVGAWRHGSMVAWSRSMG